MKKIFKIIAALAILASSSKLAFAQSKLSLSVTVAPFYERFNGRQTWTVPQPGGGIFNPEVKTRIQGTGYWVGLHAGYAISSKFSVSTGLWLSESYLKKPAFTTSSPITVISGSNRSRNFSIPVMVNLRTSEQKLSPYFSAGVLFNFNSVNHLNISDTETLEVPGKNAGIMPTVGAGIIYTIARHIALIAQPTFSYTSKATTDSNAHTARLSFNAQIMYRF